MQKVIITEKNIGETPLECLERMRISHGISSDTPMTYAGRLDPLASGLLIILIGDECKKKDEYTSLDKEYEIRVLLGVETDSYDLLGKIVNVIPFFDEQKTFKPSLYQGSFLQAYPRYSSKVISLKEIPEEMPVKEVEIYDIGEMEKSVATGEDVFLYAQQCIQKVTGDFRQVDILNLWNDFRKKYSHNKFTILSLRVVCSSGTYMRSLAHRIGKDYGCGACAYSIHRVRVGRFSLEVE